MFVAKTRRNFGSTKWCIVCTPKPDLTTCTSRQQNHAKPPRNLVLGLKKWIGRVHCEKIRRNLEAQSGALYAPQNPISQRVPPGNGIARNHSKLSFGPQEVDWACLLRKNKTQLRKHKAVHCMHPKTRSHNGYLQAMELRETTQKLRFGPKEVDWARS